MTVPVTPATTPPLLPLTRTLAPSLVQNKGLEPGLGRSPLDPAPALWPESLCSVFVPDIIYFKMSAWFCDRLHSRGVCDLEKGPKKVS